VVVETSKISRRVINPGTSIGHVHLKVANIERALGFYRDILGFEVTQWYGDDAVFLSAGGYHHHIGGSWNPTTPLTEPQTTASPRRCTCRIPTAMASSCTGTVRERSGRVPPKAGSQW
jgi:catechol-2,3-dioxygenase